MIVRASLRVSSTSDRDRLSSSLRSFMTKGRKACGYLRRSHLFAAKMFATSLACSIRDDSGEELLWENNKL